MWLLILFAVFAVVVTLISVWLVTQRHSLTPPSESWLRAPVHVVVFDSSLRPAVANALRFWNLSLGREMFVDRDSPGLGPSVSVNLTTFDGAYTRSSYHAGNGTAPGAMVCVNSREIIAQPESLTRALAHELGHVLGLHDDDDRQSVMYRRPASGVYALRDRDLRRLRRLLQF